MQISGAHYQTCGRSHPTGGNKSGWPRLSQIGRQVSWATKLGRVVNWPQMGIGYFLRPLINKGMEYLDYGSIEMYFLKIRRWVHPTSLYLAGPWNILRNWRKTARYKNRIFYVVSSMYDLWCAKIKKGPHVQFGGRKIPQRYGKLIFLLHKNCAIIFMNFTYILG